MALNGLDAQKVEEAYQDVLAGDGAWLMVKYLTRDEVDIYAKGNGGVQEIAAAVAKYPDKSPLYGFLNYRLRKVIIKYIPVGTSRLLIARTSVHFQAVTERFLPCDAILDPTSPSDFSDAALSAACTLTAGSILQSSANSLRPQGLDEIAEDAEEPQSPIHDEASEVRANGELKGPDGAMPGDATDRRPADDFKPSSPMTPVSTASRLPEVEVSSFQLAMDRMMPPDSPGSTVKSPSSKDTEVQQSYPYEFAPSPSMDTPDLSYASRPSTSELFKHGLISVKPKSKLFPRPAEKRPDSLTTFRQKLPKGMRMPFQKRDTDRPKSSKSHKQQPVGPTQRSETEPLPTSRFNSARAAMPRMFGGLKSTPSASALPRHVRLPSTSSNGQAQDIHRASGPSQHEEEVQVPRLHLDDQKPAVVSVEKQRLMRAVQIRKQQLNGSEGLTAKADSGVEMGGAKLFGAAQSQVSPPASPISSAQSPWPTTPPDKTETSSDFRETTSTSNMEAWKPRANGTRTPTTVEPQLERFEKDATSGATNPAVRHQTKSPTGLDRSQKRRGVVDPLTVEIPSATSEDDYMSEDSLIKELQSAKVQEAKPVTVPRPPVVSTPQGKLGQRRPSNSSVTSVIIKGHSRNNTSTSQANLHRPTTSESHNEALAVSKKANISSGISRRIRALAESSTKEAYAMPSYGSSSNSVTPSSYLNFQRPSGYVPSYSSSFAPSTSAGSRPASPNLPYSMRSADPAYFQPIDSISTSYDWSQTSNPSQADRISVTARIVRDPRTKTAIPNRMQNAEPMQLHQSPLIVERQSMSLSRPPSRGSMRTTERTPSILSSPRPVSRDSTITSIPKRSRDSIWRIPRRRDEDQSDPPLGRTFSINSQESLLSEGQGEKRLSRTSRFLRRMSIGTRNTPSAAGGTVTDPIKTPGAPPPPVAVGDLNVQFPDTLLWKRRWAEVDRQGFLVLAASKAHLHPQNVTRKFHMSEFKTPHMPSSDRQELPHSVVFDFIVGGTLQFACEDPIRQIQVLRRFRDIHRAWLMYDMYER